MMNLGNNMAAFRKKLGFSQETLGEKVGVTRQTISNWEGNVTVPDAYQLIALSKALQISLDTLVGNDTNAILVEKVSNVEIEVIKANKLLKVAVYTLLFVVLLLLFVFISSN